MSPAALTDLARQALDIESRALNELRARLDGESGAAFVRAVQAVLACHGRVAVMGMGKSGHVGRKIAATLASTGTPALFVHPAEAHHGDLGMVQPGDVVLAISNSGESEELTGLLPVLKRQGVERAGFDLQRAHRQLQGALGVERGGWKRRGEGRHGARGDSNSIG